MDYQFDRCSQCEKKLTELMQLDPHDPLQQGMLAALVDLCEQESGRQQDGTFKLKFGRWVIRTDDLGVFAAIRSAMASLGGVHFTFNNLTASGVTSLAVAVTELLWNVYRATGHVNARQARILSIMKRVRGQSLSVEDLASQPWEGDMDWTGEQIAKELKGLQKVPTKAGLKQMVDQDHEGRWVLLGV